jgi:ribosomal protein L31
MHLALGHICHFYDCGTNREQSKTIKGIKQIEQIIIQIWNNNYPAYTPQQQTAKRKIQYFKRYYTGTTRLITHSKKTTNDGNKTYYKNLITGYYNDR